jgi:hypothetical protein
MFHRGGKSIFSNPPSNNQQSGLLGALLTSGLLGALVNI